jgi:hypothetical protein
LHRLHAVLTTQGCRARIPLGGAILGSNAKASGRSATMADALHATRVMMNAGRTVRIAFAIVALVVTTTEAQTANLSDMALCNEQAQAKAVPPSAMPRERAPLTVTPGPGIRTDPSGTIVIESPDPLLQGMATDGLEDPVYRTAYRECMAARRQGKGR